MGQTNKQSGHKFTPLESILLRQLVSGLSQEVRKDLRKAQILLQIICYKYFILLYGIYKCTIIFLIYFKHKYCIWTAKERNQQPDNTSPMLSPVISYISKSTPLCIFLSILLPCLVCFSDILQNTLSLLLLIYLCNISSAHLPICHYSSAVQ